MLRRTSSRLRTASWPATRPLPPVGRASVHSMLIVVVLETRGTIAAAAMALFGQHGYDGVTVADVARAAGVSEKTVFNYFPAKEDLVFNEGEARRDALIHAIRTRPADTSLVEPF